MKLELDLIPHAYRKRCSKVFGYGTAGFRTKADDLTVVMFRMGVLAVLRSKAKKASIGVMITASHNPSEDNGVKLIDPRGDMLETSWEDFATQLANAEDAELQAVVDEIIETTKLDDNALSSVATAFDTRPSSLDLHDGVKAGFDFARGTVFTKFGLLTTPQLHFIVRSLNFGYGDPSEEGYYQKMSKAFRNLNSLLSSAYGKDVVYVDAANGVGGLALKKLMSFIEDDLKAKITNIDEGALNEKCGADFVKVDQTIPKIYTPNNSVEPLSRWVSFDGDGDRLIYFYLDESGRFNMVDGDKISALFASFVKDLLINANLIQSVEIGVVQTAYANGSSTNYINNVLGIETFCVPTGVKHLHKQAEHLDIGVYFEANGHGTILFSDKVKSLLKELTENENASETEKRAASNLQLFIDLINETVGDAISDFLAVESILRYRNWSVIEWNSIYKDLPNRQLKVKVADRSAVQTTDAERKCTAPADLQDKLDQLVANYKNGRAFVRPSGTEDVVRVYAEADTTENAYKLASDIAHVVSELIGVKQ